MGARRQTDESADFSARGAAYRPPEIGTPQAMSTVVHFEQPHLPAIQRLKSDLRRTQRGAVMKRYGLPNAARKS